MTQTVSKPDAHQPRVALFIDGENISPDYAGRIIVESQKHGQLALRRVYGAVPKIPGWDAAPGFRIIHTGSGKNGADLLLAIEAVALSYEGRADVFVLVSSDGDFSHLALHLRERGFAVIGMGEAKAPPKFKKACKEFFRLGLSDAEIAAQAAQLIKAHNGPISIKLLGSQMGHKGILISEHPKMKWRAFLNGFSEMFCCEGVGQEARVSLVAKD